MDSQEKDKIAGQSQVLRAELKAWESEFAGTHGGNKPAKEDIKSNPNIAHKYREYNKLRDLLSGKVASREPSSPQRHKSRKRKDESRIETPSKRLQTIKTPSKSPSQTAIIDQYDSPSIIRKLFTPLQNKVIGPTPQKDGQVLGLFDLLLDDDSPTVTAEAGKNSITNNVQATPSKSQHLAEDSPNGLRHSRTPASSGKRFMLDSFATPLKRRHPDEQGGKTPSSISKLHFSTPSFLRRDSHRAAMPAIDEDGDGTQLSPQTFRLPRKPLVRGLSNMLASLRKMQDEAADDDLDALREVEMAASPHQSRPAARARGGSESLLVADSPVPLLPLGGFDDEAAYDTEPEEQLGRDGLPLPQWKKKGQKRTTRKVTLKPVRSKAPPSRQPVDPPPDLADDIEPIADAAKQPTPDAALFQPDARNFDTDTSGSEYTASEGGTRRRRNRPREPRRRTTTRGDAAAGAKAKKKVSPAAHANFKRLKLRNAGAKGGPGVGSRFRRRK
ncbi:MAG: DNA replication regulator sld2 [Claussenomyces sp. TS43310]|nr:MAG: DNA replication regulator sld2 [Claussenomyces sp. TS43310]